jgi:hypothetical protein
LHNHRPPVHALYIHAFISLLIFTPIAADESEPFHFGVMKRLKCRTEAFKNLHHFWFLSLTMYLFCSNCKSIFTFCSIFPIFQKKTPVPFQDTGAK